MRLVVMLRGRPATDAIRKRFFLCFKTSLLIVRACTREKFVNFNVIARCLIAILWLNGDSFCKNSCIVWPAAATDTISESLRSNFRRYRLYKGNAS